MIPADLPSALRRLLFAAMAWAVASQPIRAADQTEDQRLAWFHRDKFGLFIHWGLYAVPAGEWRGQVSPGIGEWIMNRLRIPVKDYAQLAGQFYPRHFDADAWAQLAADTGMKYVIITAKHHDGFAMYHSRVSLYNVYDATPFHRDPVKELADACARHGLRFGVYYSQVIDWHEPGGGGGESGRGNDWDFPPNAETDGSGRYEKYVREKALPQVRELLQNFGPISIIWFDSPRKARGDLGNLFLSEIRSLQSQTLISGRLLPDGVGGDYLSTGDNAIPVRPEARSAWEVPATVNQTWAYRRDDTNWKSPGDLLYRLVDIVSKGGNYLLNVGPTADGVIPAECQDNLRTVGRWLKANGEAIYGVGPSPFGDEFGEFSRQLAHSNGKPEFLAFNEWRCTTRPGRLYFILFHVDTVNDQGVFPLPAFRNEIRSVHMLNDPSGTALPVQTGPGGQRRIPVTRYVNDVMGSVLVVDFAGGKIIR